MRNPFEVIGYSREYYVGGKYIGSVRLETPDREIKGYNGRIHEEATQDIIFGKKRIKKGQRYFTECITLCGRML